MKKLMWIFALLAMAGIGFAAFSVSASTNKQVFRPGESGAITLVVSNSAGANTITSAKLEINGNPGFTYQDSVLIGDMNAGTSTTLTVPLTVKPGTPSGVYVFNIRIYGSELAGDGSSDFNYKEASIPIYVLNPPILLISGYSKDYSEGSEFSFKIDNKGGIAKNVRLMALSPFSIAGANEIYLGDVVAGKNTSINLDVGDVSEGANTLQLRITYDDELGNSVNETKDIALTVSKETPDISFLQISKITSSMDNTVTLRVVNGAKQLSGVKLSFSNPDIILKGGEEVRIGDLASGQTKEVTFTMHPGVSPGTVNENATITYTDSGEQKTETIKVALTFDSDSDVQVYIESKPLPVAAGQEETLSVTVANTWDYPIESSSVKISGDFFDLLSVQDEQYIGLLNKDDFSSVQFKIRIKDDAKPVNNLTVRVKYKDAFGNFVERQKVLQVRVGEKSAEQGSPLPLLLGAGVVVVAAYLLFFRKKKPSQA